jgi:DNA polymerase III subunit delta
MEITAEKIMQQLHKGEQVASVIAVFGEEGYYKDKIAAALPQAVFGDAAQEDREVTVFERDTDLKELSAVINTYPFFSGRSLVVLKDEKLWGGKDAGEKRKQQQEELAVLLADVPDHCQVLVLGEKIDKRSKLYKSLLKTAAMVECKPVKAYQLKPWLDEQAAVRGCRFDYEASQTIMEYLSVTDNAPLLLLEQEIEKLAVYAGQRKIWTQNDVEQVFAALPEVSRFALLNAIAEKRLGQATAIYQQCLPLWRENKGRVALAHIDKMHGQRLWPQFFVTAYTQKCRTAESNQQAAFFSCKIVPATAVKKEHQQ